MHTMRIVVTAAIVAGGALGQGCREPVEPPETVIRRVRYLEVQVAGDRQARTFSGVARAGVESTLSFRVSGTIERLLVEVGDRVQRRQPIATLDPVDYELQVKETEAALRQAEAEAGNAAADLRRVRRLYENDNASRDDLDAAIAAADSAMAQVESVEKRLELAQRQVGHTRLLAPVAGAIADVPAEVNENVAPGEAIVVLTSGAAPEVEVAIPEGLISQIEDDSIVTVAFDAIPDVAFAGTVSEVGVMATATGTTFPVIVRLTNGVPAIRPGMAAEITFTFAVAGATDRVIVPSAAVAEDREGRFVFVAEPIGDGRAVVRRRPVRVGTFAENGLEVLDGLAAGDLVVSAGVSRIQDGLEVRLTAEEG